ncbi:MAG TPA: MipA/OmpV family protein [Steroidobacteraceae bacterium]|nr:MipA/OmpV family protein [Steroidobacteraceae bacterium]
MTIPIMRAAFRPARLFPSSGFNHDRWRASRAGHVASQLACLAALLWAFGSPTALAQTPSPMQEWQYSGGVVLARLFEPNLPDWRVVAGLAAQVQPIYDGANAYKVRPGPVIDVRYKDVGFFSVGDGLGINILHGDHYQAGVAVAYDLGRKVSDDYTHLHGLGDISPAPAFKAFGTYVLAKKFPLVLRADIRQIVGGANGTVGDLEAYLPLPGSSKTFVMFAGPSITYADHRYTQHVFGVTPAQALASGYPRFGVHGGQNAVGVGFSATRFLTKHWLVNLDAALNHLRGSADESPITQSRRQRVLALSTEYMW